MTMSDRLLLSHDKNSKQYLKFGICVQTMCQPFAIPDVISSYITRDKETDSSYTTRGTSEFYHVIMETTF